jgi:hypothetical protein
MAGSDSINSPLIFSGHQRSSAVSTESLALGFYFWLHGFRIQISGTTRFLCARPCAQLQM